MCRPSFRSRAVVQLPAPVRARVLESRLSGVLFRWCARFLWCAQFRRVGVAFLLVRARWYRLGAAALCDPELAPPSRASLLCPLVSQPYSVIRWVSLPAWVQASVL